MELAEAVRIVRDQTIPALRAMWRDWYPVHVAALEAVLAALEQAQRERYEALSVTSKEGLLASEWVARTGRAEAEVARLRAQWDAGVLAGMRATAEQQGQIVVLTAALRELVRGIDAWDAAVGKIIAQPVGHKREGLERAREILRDTAPEVKP